jgi:cell division transport system permease protein
LLDRISFILGEAFEAIRRNLTMTYAAIATVALTLFLFGGVGYSYFHLNKLSESLTGKFEMRAYMVDGAKIPQVQATAKAIREIPGVAVVNWIPKDRAWEREKAKYKPEVTDGIENPLPEAFKIILSDLKRADSVAASIRALPNLDPKRGVEYLRDEQRLLEQTRSFLNWLATGLGGLLLLTSGILIYNAIRLAVFSRRREARVMMLVGASRFSVRVPYLIEGFIYGTVGGILATGMLYAAQRAIESRLLDQTAFAGLPPFPILPGLALLSIVGAVYGLVCSYIAILVPMKP